MSQERRDLTLYARLSRLGAGPDSPRVVRTLVEIPKGSCNKYEMDEETGLIRLDRNLSTSNVYPGDYGFIPGTLSEDGDPLDVLIAVNEPTFPGCLIDARVIGVFFMVDGGDGDEKIIAVPNRDPHFAEITDIGDMPAHFKRHVEHFFMTYKELEGGDTASRGWGDREAARKIVVEALASYAAKALEGRDAPAAI
ncbi:Inorganic pyrophosphatase [Planctomycetes bacterium Poly30]|uniref:Inorganic pyrophosphatase n=1 Tax=Saltatorellus ferox TaxID=2528018 RepID=A0A518EKI9_9BACT|nr:Inorganic pyrophosphatase [Planctomycetes bacterium Poly30]